MRSGCVAGSVCVNVCACVSVCTRAFDTDKSHNPLWKSVSGRPIRLPSLFCEKKLVSQKLPQTNFHHRRRLPYPSSPSRQDSPEVSRRASSTFFLSQPPKEVHNWHELFFSPLDGRHCDCKSKKTKKKRVLFPFFFLTGVNALKMGVVVEEGMWFPSVSGCDRFWPKRAFEHGMWRRADGATSHIDLWLKNSISAPGHPGVRRPVHVHTATHTHTHTLLPTVIRKTPTHRSTCTRSHTHMSGRKPCIQCTPTHIHTQTTTTTT